MSWRAGLAVPCGLVVSILVGVGVGVGAPAGEPSAGEPPAGEPAREPTRWEADRRLGAKARAAGAAERREAEVDRMLADAGIGEARELLLVAFKEERVLEAWVAGAVGDPMQLVARYRFCAASGGPGPKRRQGDRQVPEGFYRVSGFNPRSLFHLSLRVDYPNASDRILGRRGALGGDIMIHGGCASIGCLALSDERIEELWVLARRARRPIHVHIYPARDIDALIASGAHPEHHAFWRDLGEGLARFEATRRPPRTRVARDGRYRFTGAVGKRPGER